MGARLLFLAAAVALLAAAACTIWIGTQPPKGPALAGFSQRIMHTFSWPATSPVHCWLAGMATARGYIVWLAKELCCWRGCGVCGWTYEGLGASVAVTVITRDLLGDSDRAPVGTSAGSINHALVWTGAAVDFVSCMWELYGSEIKPTLR